MKYHCQQFTYGVVSEGFFAESLRKFCGKFAEIFRRRRYVLLRQERVRKFCGKFAEISLKVAENFLQCPLSERPHKCIADIGPKIITLRHVIFQESRIVGGKFWAPWTHKPRNGLLRTLCGFRRFLEGPFGGFRVQGALKRSSYRATEDTLNT